MTVVTKQYSFDLLRDDTYGINHNRRQAKMLEVSNTDTTGFAHRSHFTLKLKRKPEYYIKNYIVLITLTCSLAFLVRTVFVATFTLILSPTSTSASASPRSPPPSPSLAVVDQPQLCVVVVGERRPGDRLGRTSIRDADLDRRDCNQMDVFRARGLRGNRGDVDRPANATRHVLRFRHVVCTGDPGVVRQSLVSHVQRGHVRGGVLSL